MKVKNGRLQNDSGEPVAFRKSPNVGGAIDSTLLVMHFTAGSTAEGAIDWLCNPESKVSAHVVVARNGSVTQLVSLKRKANHAGRSVWNGRRWCNGFAIGIELDNAGKLARKRGKWVSEFGKTYPDDEVVKAKHKNEKKPAGWLRYTPEQLRAAREVATAIVRDLGIPEIVGHEDISPKRKNDPGPAFPMEAFREAVLADAGMTLPATVTMVAPEVGEPEIRVATGVEYEVFSETAIRRNPSPRSRKLLKKPLPKGTVVRPLPQDWYFVEIVGDKDAEPVKGWVRVSDLSRAAEPESLPTLPTLDESPVSAPSDAAAAKRRMEIAAKIVDFEARRDSKGRIRVYRLPANDGGGSYEIAGINQRFHPDEAGRLRELINAGRHEEAEKLAAEYIASYTDGVAKWTNVGSIEAFLRDSAFNRGPTGAARILQIALGVKVDGKVGPITLEALRKAEQDPKKLLADLRAARETYELRSVGRRANFWKGLVNRWDNALEFATSFA